jgi:hypothetical protein
MIDPGNHIGLGNSMKQYSRHRCEFEAWSWLHIGLLSVHLELSVAMLKVVVNQKDRDTCAPQCFFFCSP